MVFEDRWECGWCLDSGLFLSPYGRAGSISLRFVCRVDLGEAWGDLKAALAALAPRHARALLPGLGRAALYRLSISPPPEDGETEPTILAELRPFLDAEKDLGAPEDAAARIERGGILFEDDGVLSEERFGRFWQSLLDALEDENRIPWETDTDDFFCTLALFGSWRRGGSGNDPGYTAQCDALQHTFHRRWEKLHPAEDE